MLFSFKDMPVCEENVKNLMTSTSDMLCLCRTFSRRLLVTTYNLFRSKTSNVGVVGEHCADLLLPMACVVIARRLSVSADTADEY